LDAAKRKTWECRRGVRRAGAGRSRGTYFAVAADEQPALARVDTEAGERVDFDLLLKHYALALQFSIMIRTNAPSRKSKSEYQSRSQHAFIVIQSAQHPSIAHCVSKSPDFAYRVVRNHRRAVLLQMDR